MRQLLSFRMPTCNIRARGKDSDINISLHIRSRDLDPAKYHISGFPRAVMKDNEPKSSETTISPSARRDSPREPQELATSGSLPELDAPLERPAAPYRSVSEQSTLADAEQALTDRKSGRRSIYTSTNRYASRSQQPAELLSERTRSHRMPQDSTQHRYAIPSRSVIPAELPSNDIPALNKPSRPQRSDNTSRVATDSSSRTRTTQTNDPNNPGVRAE
jgi:hypothetical protein